MMPDEGETAGARLNVRLESAGLEPLEAGQCVRFEEYLSLILRWNARVNLTAIRDEEGILSRHFVESITCARCLPSGIATLLDFGSGAGFPGIPIALCRPEIAVTLAESQGKKAAFLQEAIRLLGIASTVYSGRAETLKRQFDCVTLRAVDRMQEATKGASRLVRPGGWLVPMTTRADLAALEAAAGSEYFWELILPLAGGEDRVAAIGKRISLPA
jgi:16S rRNA (guanine527-N7)-methyltransferase